MKIGDCPPFVRQTRVFWELSSSTFREVCVHEQ